MQYKPKEISLNQLRKETSDELASAVQRYFIQNPYKTTFKVADKFVLRKKKGKPNVFFIIPR